MPGIDKPTRRVVAVIVLLILVAAALRGYLPGDDGSSRAEPGSGRAALTFVIGALGASVALMAFAVIARLRDPRATAPSAGDLSDMLGGRKGQASWRVLLIGLGVIAGWLLIAMLLSHLVAPPDVTTPPPPTDLGAPPTRSTAAPPQQPSPDNDADTVQILLAWTLPLFVLILAAAALTSRRRWRAATIADIVDGDGQSPAPKRAESLVRAARRGLAEMADLDRDPREAIIACYLAMERELAHIPGAAPQDFDTPTEVLARAVERHALHADNAAQLVNLFAEARFSPHVMNEGHRDAAVRALRLVLEELAPRTHGSAV
ncbi:DUF4129 domain-containing protein [Mycobacterium simiae]|uniref:DUF4129 domain-containing protein n=1 Tax=Mycobacterium simiae TaxID=1784 RepID=A0A5B1BPQ0_MYCSI|nr:DUF4129 domain-containing protein [Mycobacterium simiae]KAA1250416.1 DUF4129 domain-containing protein [Mycobacterium simiae]